MRSQDAPVIIIRSEALDYDFSLGVGVGHTAHRPEEENCTIIYIQGSHDQFLNNINANAQR